MLVEGKSMRREHLAVTMMNEAQKLAWQSDFYDAFKKHGGFMRRIDDFVDGRLTIGKSQSKRDSSRQKKR